MAARDCGPTADRRYLQVAIEDTGIGIPDDQMANLFKPFSQLKTTSAGENNSRRHQQQHGGGLGLAIAKHLTQLMRGDVWAESAGDGRGSLFTFCIRVEIPAPEVLEKLRKASATVRPVTPDKGWDATLSARVPLRILVVDDNMYAVHIIFWQTD